jgi:hypothetical protein
MHLPSENLQILKDKFNDDIAVSQIYIQTDSDPLEMELEVDFMLRGTDYSNFYTTPS